MEHELREYFRSNLRKLGQDIKAHRRSAKECRSQADKMSHIPENGWYAVAKDPSKQGEFESLLRQQYDHWEKQPYSEQVTALINIYHCLRGSKYRHGLRDNEPQHEYWVIHYSEDIEEKFGIEVDYV